MLSVYKKTLRELARFFIPTSVRGNTGSYFTFKTLSSLLLNGKKFAIDIC